MPLAEQSLRDTMARLPGEPDAHRALARYLLDQHRPFEALWHFQLAQHLNPADADASIQAARALAQAGFPDRAVPLLRARLARSPGDLEARQALAELFFATARPNEALAALAGAGKALTTSAPAQLLLGDVHLAAGDAAGARAAYRRATELEPEAAVAHDRLGRLALARGDWAEAKQAFAAARERELGAVGHAYRLGLAYWGAGQHEEAERLWQEVAASAPHDAPVRLALGKAYQSHRDWSAAAYHLAAAVTADPASKEAQFALAQVMTAQGDPASAWYQRGLYYLQTDRPQRAVAAFRRMAALAPERVDGPRMTSLAYTQIKRLDLAAAEAQRGLDRHPNDPRLLAHLALLHVLGRNRPRAVQFCQEWLKREPNAADPYRLLGRIAREEQRLPDALRFGEKALDREPQNAVICADLAKTFAAMGGSENIRRAIELARQATELSPREGDDWLQLGTLLRSGGDPAAAADALLRALDLDPSSVQACSGLVEIAARERRPESIRFYASLVTALQRMKQANNLLWEATYHAPADAAARARLARALLAAGDLRRARSQLEEVAALRPGDAAARRDLALVDMLLDLRSE
jgi:tetratricopeptide (TPR) repeat protein